MGPYIKIFVIAISLALDVFAVSVGVGVRGPAPGIKLRIGIAFAVAEVVMNIFGALLGAAAGKLLGDAAGYLGFAALIGVGLYMLWEARKESDEPGLDLSRGWGLFLASLAISLDSLGIGFSILYIGVPIALSLGVIFVVSIASTSAGLALGKSLGKAVEERAEVLGGVLLALTGIVFALLKALHIG